ncbi:DUF1203 domain-containing protein [Chromobacterium sp. IIBBL 290-4]|uniref:DUF1203 domain-containing protein n=1 Tax=Chromobacterium sp. IIBBL 290-4 TaxID=2953890 RepID=UPI0020B6F898|nr:DUF1203 domain-containing protein [Chromobacterium sp. IIBBL 290-4]UTH75895.1 DUF1203 domain-containing protein [Chromobacterium sp. IIBBL 290-4]
MAWRIEALDEAFLAQARTQGVDAQGQPVRRVAANGGERLRDGLCRARPGEGLMLASYSPFRQSGPYKEYGPVFFGVEPGGTTLPALAALLAEEDGYLREEMALRAYDAGQSIVEAAILPLARIQARLDQWADRADIVFAMLRFPAYGCYALRLNRDA